MIAASQGTLSLGEKLGLCEPIEASCTERSRSYRIWTRFYCFVPSCTISDGIPFKLWNNPPPRSGPRKAFQARAAGGLSRSFCEYVEMSHGSCVPGGMKAELVGCTGSGPRILPVTSFLHRFPWTVRMGSHISGRDPGSWCKCSNLGNVARGLRPHASSVSVGETSMIMYFCCWHF